jgi:hypothetical protein
VHSPSPFRFWIFSVLSPSLLFLSGCTAAFGPGYSIEKQTLIVQFLPAPEPHILVQAEYQLRNTGNQPLSSIEIRSPGRRFHLAALRADWDGSPAAFSDSPGKPRNSILTIPQIWSVSARHSLRLSFEIARSPSGDGTLNYTPTATYNGPGNGDDEPVAIGVSGQSSFARFIKLPPVEKKKIPEIVRFEAIQHLTTPSSRSRRGAASLSS